MDKKVNVLKNSWMTWAGCLLVSCSIAVAESSPTKNIEKLHTRIINGDVISRRSVPVVEISIVDRQDEYLCSGSMIAPNIVLTARHCVTNRASDHTVNLKGKLYAVSKVKIHPLSRVIANGDLIYDLALLYLKNNPNASFFPVIKSQKAKAGDTILIYGYGLDERGKTGVLERGAMVVTSSDRRWVNATYVGNGDSNTCEGDSGGPALGVYRTVNGVPSYGIIAATAGGDFEDCSVGDHSYFTNLQSSETISFLKKNVPGLVLR